MQSTLYTLRRIAIGTLVMLALMGVLATCGSDDNKDTPEKSPVPAVSETPVATRIAAAPTFTPGPGTVYPTSPVTALPPTEQPTLTPWPTPTITATYTVEQAQLAEAVEFARNDLVARINISLDEIEVIDPENVQPGDLVCPLPPEDLTDVTLSVVYLRHLNLLYPYQYYVGVGGVLVVEACETTLTDASILVAPTPNSRVTVIDGVRADLQARGVDPVPGDYTVQEIVWTDDALGCPAIPGQPTPQPAMISGYAITYTLHDTTYVYHTDDTGAQIVICATPAGFATADAFIEALVLAFPEYVLTTEETMQYSDMDAVGRVITMTDMTIPVVVFEFGSPDEARQAAADLRDPEAKARFVVGNVLAVMTDSSPEIYALLSTYGVQVR